MSGTSSGSAGDLSCLDDQRLGSYYRRQTLPRCGPAKARAMHANTAVHSMANIDPRSMIILDNVITDRGSKYAVSGGLCSSADEARIFLAELKRNKKFAKATHNSWGLICGDQMIKNDDGEAGAGMVILRMLEREELRNHIVVVTRWFGGKQLGGDRFRHVREAVRTYIKAL